MSVVIKLEGGTDSDLDVLDCPPSPPPEEQRRSSTNNPLMSPHGDDTEDSPADGKKEAEPSSASTSQQTLKFDKTDEKGTVINIRYLQSPWKQHVQCTSVILRMEYSRSSIILNRHDWAE